MCDNGCDGRMLRGPGASTADGNRWADVVAVYRRCIDWGRCPLMVRLSLTKLAAAVGGAAFALTAGYRDRIRRSADPVVNTTCNYGQVMAALNATDPAAAAQLNRIADGAELLAQFLAAPPPQRVQMAQQIRAMPQAAPYFKRRRREVAGSLQQLLSERADSSVAAQQAAHAAQGLGSGAAADP